MKKNLLKLRFAVLVAVLFACVTGMWADDDTQGQDVYFVALTAESSPESTGEGKVRLILVDIKGKEMEKDNFGWLNEVNYAEGNSVTMVGATISATEGLEMEAGSEEAQMYMTSYAYYFAEVQPAAGSYFAGWTVSSYVDQKKDKDGNVTFKVLSDKDNKLTLSETTDMSSIEQHKKMACDNARHVYAVFRKYLLSNSSAIGGQVEGESGKPMKIKIEVSMDIEGDAGSLDLVADLDINGMSITDDKDNEDNRWAKPTEEQVTKKRVNAQKTTITLPITFTAQDGMTSGDYKFTLTISTKGTKPSTLKIPIAVTVLNHTRPDAILLNGKEEKRTGILSELIKQVQTNHYDDPIIRLNKDHAAALECAGGFTLDLNGNKMGDITLTGGEMTIAYSKFGGSAGKISVEGGKLIMNGGTFNSLTINEGATVEQNGATITGFVTNYGNLTTTQGTFSGGLTSDGTLALNGGSFAGETAITISDGTATLNRGNIVGTNYGVLAEGGKTEINKLAAISGGNNSLNANGGTVTVNCGKFGAPISGTNIKFTSGYFIKKADYENVRTDGMTEMQLTTGVEYNEGYRYFLGTAEAATDNKVGVCRIGETSYATLEDALAYANNNPDKEVIIFMTNNYVLPAGYYTVSKKATIVVPMSDTQAKMINESAPKIVYNDAATETPYTMPTEFRRLTFADGVNIDVFGAIELTCHQYSSNEAYTGQPVGPYGRLEMKEGSHMTLQDGSQLRAWGYMTGKGETDARRGATVHEFFQMGDWKGAVTSVKIVGLLGGNDHKKKIFPVNQYFIQNIESPVKYHPGAVLTTAAAVSEGVFGMNITMATNDIKIIGVDGVDRRDDAIFLMNEEADAENTWVQKSYIVDQDIQNYDVNSSAYIGSMVIDLGTVPFDNKNVPVVLNSEKFDLPITSNMKIHLRSGLMYFLQNTSLIPGSEVEVDKQSTVTIAMNEEDSEAKEKGETDHVYHSGALYVYDAADWGRFAYAQGKLDSMYTKVVRYTPSWNGSPSIRQEGSKPASAKINVHGTFNTGDGFVYTSKHGANIFSSNEDAGTFIFSNGADNVENRKVYSIKGRSTFDSTYFYPAQLRNGNGNEKKYTDTKDAQQNDSYCYSNNQWSIWQVAEDKCFMTDKKGFYAKPQEYVKVVVAKGEDGKPKMGADKHFQGNDDHTYSDAAGAGRLFILTNDCSWWEVEVKDNRYHCVHPDNDTYYEWNETTKKWQEVRYSIRWQNWNGEVIKTSGGNAGPAVESYSVPYGTMAEFLGTNPTRPADIDYTYDFVGWSPELGRVTSDVTYTAQYKRKQRKYTVVFCNESGTEIERHFLTRNEMPACENTPTKVGHYLQWTPAIAAVTGDATYTATWLEEKPTEYQVTFVDYDGKTVLQKGPVAAGIMPTAPTDAPSGKIDAYKDTNKEFTYDFVGWSPELEPAKSDITYTAVYKEVKREYTVTFVDENGKEIETKQWSYGAIPVCSNLPTKADDAQYSYSLVWTPQLEAVKENKTYTAKLEPTTKKYTVTLRSNNDAVCTFTGAGIYEYGTKVKIAVTPATGYEFVRWEERDGGADLGEITVTGDISLTAVVKTTAVDISDLKLGTSDEVDVATLLNKEVMDLIIESNGTKSGQLKNADQLKVDGSAHFDLSLGFKAHTWYAFGLPWRVSTNGGLQANGQTLQVDKNCFILEYDGALRASGNVNEETASYWNYVHAGATLLPGHLYMIYLTSAANTVRFTKVANVTIAPIVNTTIEMAAYSSSAGADAGWNGIANPTTYNATLSADGITIGQKYIPGQPDKDGKNTDRYDPFELTSEHLAVGQPIFVQVTAAKTLVADESACKFNAPRRESSADDLVEYELRLAPAGSHYTDRLYVAAADEKDDAYVIGQDVAKISVAQGVAQWWVERYNTKLAANTTEISDNEAFFPLGIYVPADGNYQLTVATPVAADHELMLTCDGLPVQDLSNGDACTITLKAGKTLRYGLLLVRKSPSISTDDGAVKAEQTNIRKVFVGGHVYIIRDGNVYSIVGHKIQ